MGIEHTLLVYELKVILAHILPAHSLSSKLVNENILCKVFLTQSHLEGKFRKLT